jgi:catechol 2,3-dioxygenase-like lactoylglutathione lyase family enzyme
MAIESRKLAEILASGPLKPAKLSHVVLRTARLHPTRDWYLTALNGRVQYEGATVCFLTYDDEHHRLGIVQIPGVTDESGSGPGLEHISFAYRSLGELLANYQRLKALDIVPYWTINHGPTISMYYRDPDRNSVEFQYDVFATAEQANHFIKQNYAENFMGIIFNPQEMIQKFEAGVSLDEILKRPKLPAGKTPWDMHRA